MSLKLAIISTHPIQYFAPVFKLLAKECTTKVFYTWGLAGVNQKFDKDFGKKIQWDIPLLEGYDHEFLKNNSGDPGSHHFRGIQNPDIIDRINDFEPSVIFVYGWAYWSHLKVIRHFSGKIPVWFRGDSTLIDEKSSWKKLMRKALLNWVYHYIDKAFYVGTANKAYFKKFGLKEHQLVFSPHAVDNDRFAEDRSIEANSIRKHLEVSESDVLILFAGKLERRKNPGSLLESFIQLNKPNVHLLFVGNGELEQSLKLKVESLSFNSSFDSTQYDITKHDNGIQRNSSQKERIHFMDFQNQSYMPAIYQASDLVCLPSETETWGLVINEAMAAGRAVLVSEKVGCALDLVDGSNGTVFCNKKGLSECLNELFTDKKKLIKMGLESKMLIANWTFKKQTNAILCELEDLKNG